MTDQEINIAVAEPQPASWYWPIWKHMSDNHGLTLLDSECEDILQVANTMRMSNSMTHQLNTWSPPEVARTWPEGSQIVWRWPRSMPVDGKHYGYGMVSCFLPDEVGTIYEMNRPRQEFMLLELPI